MPTSTSPPKELSPGYTDHDAHGYRHGLGPCICSACKEIHAASVEVNPK